MAIDFLKGDATLPIGNGNKIIVHICNDAGGWGKGFVVAISRRWKKPEAEFRHWFAHKQGTAGDGVSYPALPEETPESAALFGLGNVQLVQVEEGLWIANIIGQKRLKPNAAGEPPVRYEAIEKGLAKLTRFAREQEAKVHMPRIGCGLAGGRWEIIEQMIDRTLTNGAVAVTVYDFDAG